jgi:hypothetical protein
VKRHWTSDGQLYRAALLLALGLPGCAARAPEVATPLGREQAPSADWLMREGRAAALRGDTVRAEQYIVLAVDRGYDERHALPLLLGVCIKGSRLRAALNHAEPYLRDHPTDTALRYLVGTIHVGLSDEAGARRELEVLLRDDPEHAEALFLLGVLELDHDPETSSARLLDYLRVEPTGRHAADVRVRLRELAREREEDARLFGLAPSTPAEPPHARGVKGRAP